MAQNLNDAFAWIRDLYTEIARLKSGAILQNSSVSQGQMRFIGGRLLIDSGGTLQVIGQFDGTGNFEWSGPWKFDSGDGEIAGNVNLTGDFNLTGQMDVTGGIEILGPGKIKVGNVIIENGKITAGTGAAQVTIDGETGKVTAGDMTMDPTVSGGALTFANGAQVFTDAGTVQLYKGSSVVQVTDGYARLQNGGDVVEINDNGIRMSPGAVSTLSGSGLPVGVMIHGADGYVRKSDGT